MILHDASLYGKKGFFHVWIRNGRLAAVADRAADLPPGIGGTDIDLEGALVLPGFINSHDHLDFNLFPQLGGKHYNDYTEWGPAIQREHADLVARIRRVPLPLRVAWGQYKNVLNGCTTVVNHGDRLQAGNDLVTVYQEAQSLHSAAFEKKWKWKLNNPLRLRQSVAIHAGEGTTEQATAEVEEITNHNWLRRDIVAIHGVAMRKGSAARFRGLVWCPASNYFLLGRTADVVHLMEETNVVFGTDSTLTSSWNAWEHFRQALSHVSEEELLAMLTTKPALLWGMHDRGTLRAGAAADLVILRYDREIFDNNPSSILGVMRSGRFVAVDEALPGAPFLTRQLYPVHVGDRRKWVQGDLPGLISSIQQFFPFDNPLQHA